MTPRYVRFFASSVLMLASAFVPAANAQWNPAMTNSTASLRAIHDAGRGTIWASGTNGTVLRSEDAGYMWQQCTVPPGAAKLDFRGVFGWNANHAIAMSSGTGTASRIYETNDGCASWRLLLENPDRDGFWDGIVFHGTAGYLVGDPVGGRFVLFHSNDAGRHWQREESPAFKAAPKGEGIFAASNSSLAWLPGGDLILATGGIGGPRVLRRSKGKWSALPIPLASGTETSGAFSVAFRDDTHGVVVGGDYKDPARTNGTAAWTSNGGATWHAATSFPSGYRSAVGWDTKLRAWIAVGLNGSDLSVDDGRTWRRFDGSGWNALSLPWVAGANGRIASLDPLVPAIKTALASK